MYIYQAKIPDLIYFNQIPFLKDFIINNSTKIILWKIIPGELDDKHISKEEIGLLKK